MNTRKSVALALLASGVVAGLSLASFSSQADAPVSAGRHIDQHIGQLPHTGANAAGAGVSGKTYQPGATSVGRRSDGPQAIGAKRPAEQAELAAFEEGRPVATKRAIYPHTGRRVDNPY